MKSLVVAGDTEMTNELLKDIYRQCLDLNKK